MSESSAFYLLDEQVQRFIWAEGWESLRDVQEAAIPLIIDGESDVILAAATAAGKTEAAFFPALTRILQASAPRLILYISPLKALINDQFSRLTDLCENLDIPVWRWHGDVSSSMKRRFVANASGVLLITPESLEAVLCTRGTSVRATFGALEFIVVDELHAFIGSERGKQLQSLMHRVEHAIGRTVPRLGLSATLGDMGKAAEFLRPKGGGAVSIVEAKSEGTEIRILIKGYEEPLIAKPKGGATEGGVSEGGVSEDGVAEGGEDDGSDGGDGSNGTNGTNGTNGGDGSDGSDGGSEGDGGNEGDGSSEVSDGDRAVTPGMIATHLFRVLRGANNLVFPNSRREVERYTHLLASMCEEQNVPREFWPHHGNLSKEIRTETEIALGQTDRPATAICTNTLELGIDIGAVKSIAQIGPPPSVASLRQRLGRSGRRKGEPAILRSYCVETAIGGKTSLKSELRLDAVQTIAMTLLLLEGWVEPPVGESAHFSTLVQQILSYIAQNGGATIAEIHRLLCREGAPFESVPTEELVELVRKMGQLDLLAQDSSGTLLHGGLGEKMVNHYSFYSAFTTDEEFRIVAGGRPLGTLPVSQALMEGQRILFAGRTWRVEQIDEEQRTIFVVPAGGGTPPMFSGGYGRTHTRVRQRMRELLESPDVPGFLDDTAKRFLREARVGYSNRGLSDTYLVDQGSEVVFLTWHGDAANEAIACLLRSAGLRAMPGGPGVEVAKGRRGADEIVDILMDLGAEEELPSLDVLLEDARNLVREKWDWALPEGLLRKAFAAQSLDLGEAVEWIRGLAEPTNPTE